MAENIYTEQFGNVTIQRVCTTSADLDFDRYQDPGRYDIYEECGNLQTKVYSLIVDTSEEYGCVKQTRIHEGIVDTRCNGLNGLWSDWELISGSGGSAISTKVTLHDRIDGVEIVVEDASGKDSAIVHDGDPGGYYTPSMANTAENSVLINFNPTRIDMPPVSPVKLTAPKGKDGTPGGYYVPSVTQDSEGSCTFWFDPVGEDMENPPEYPIDLPRGEPGYTPQIGTDYWTENDKQEIIGEVLERMPEASRENFTAIYNQTTWAELSEAISAGKHLYAQAGENIYILISINESKVYFSRAQQKSIDYVMIDSTGKWSSSSKQVVAKEDFDALVARVAALEGN